MIHRKIVLALVPVLAASMLACAAESPDPLVPGSVLAAKGGNGGGGSTQPLVADAVAGDFFASGGAPLVSQGPAETSKAYAALWKHSRCADITPDGSTYALTDEVRVGTSMRGGKIVAVQFWAQDVIGDEGIAHETDWVAIEPAVKPNSAGFTLHVHVDNLPVWRLDGHLSGNRVEVIGTISIGDIVYRDGTPGDCTGS